MQRALLFVVVSFIIACAYEGTKVFTEGGFSQYPLKLSRPILLIPFTFAAYLTLIVSFGSIVSTKIAGTICLFCACVTEVLGSFVLLGILIPLDEGIGLMLFNLFLIGLWMLTAFALGHRSAVSHVPSIQLPLGDHFPREFVGFIAILIFPPLFGLLIYRGLFLAGSFPDKVCGWIIAMCSMFVLSMIFFVSTLTEMCKVGDDAIYSTWTRSKIISTFSSSMFRNSILQACGYSSMLLFAANLSEANQQRGLAFCCIFFTLTFRNFPSFYWATCLSGAPKSRSEEIFLNFGVFGLAVSNHYTWLLALISTFMGCMIYSFVFKEGLTDVLLSAEAVHVYLIWRFLGIRIHAKASMAHRHVSVLSRE